MRTIQEVIHKGPLTRETICEAALRIIDTEGLSAVSMRTLASALGIKAGSLYHHFRSKEDLLDEVAELLLQNLGPLPNEGEWKDRVCASFLQLADLVEIHPQAAPLLIGSLARSHSARERARTLIVTARASGLDPGTQASLLGNLAALLAGHGVLSAWVNDGQYDLGQAGSGASQTLLTQRTQARVMRLQFEAGMRALIDGFVRKQSG